MADEALDPGWELASVFGEWTLSGRFRGLPATLVNIRTPNEPAAPECILIFLEHPAGRDLDVSRAQREQAARENPALEKLENIPYFLSLHTYADASLWRTLRTRKPVQLWRRRGSLLRLATGLVGMKPERLRRALTALAELAGQGL